MTSGAPSLRIERRLLRSGAGAVACVDEVGRGALCGPVTVGMVLVTSQTRSAPTGVRDSKLLTPQARDRLVPRIRRWAPAHAVGHASPAEIDAIGIIAALRLAGHRALAALPVRPDVVLLDGNHDYLSPPDQLALFPGAGTGLPSGLGLEDAETAGPDPHDGECTGADAEGADVGAAYGEGADVEDSDLFGVDVEESLNLAEPPDRRSDPARDEAAAEALRSVWGGGVAEVPAVVTMVKADLRCAGVAAASVLAKTARDAIMIGLADEFPPYRWADNKGYASPDHLDALRRFGPTRHHRVSWSLPVAG